GSRSACISKAKNQASRRSAKRRSSLDVNQQEFEVAAENPDRMKTGWRWLFSSNPERFFVCRACNGWGDLRIAAFRRACCYVRRFAGALVPAPGGGAQLRKSGAGS